MLNKKYLLLLALIGTLFLMGCTSPTETSISETSSAESSVNDRSNFYELDKIVQNSTIGYKIMSFSDFTGLAEGGATLEGIINQFGLPTHVIGASKGDKTIQVAFPTDEYGYSADLVFEYNPGGFGDWKLAKKSSVETDGINYPEYFPPSDDNNAEAASSDDYKVNDGIEIAAKTVIEDYGVIKNLDYESNLAEFEITDKGKNAYDSESIMKNLLESDIEVFKDYVLNEFGEKYLVVVYLDGKEYLKQ